MEKKTFERALHAWDNWYESIEQSRKLLGYDPTWPRDTCIRWIEERYPEIRKQAEDELRRLELPPTLRQYWEDCFYSDYKTQDGRTEYSTITRRLSERKSLPELPCDHGVVWHEGEDIHDPWLRVEIKLHARFATKELFNYAARLAYEAVETVLWSDQVKEHPVCQWLKGGRPPADESLALECVHLKDDKGWHYKEIGLHYGWPLQKDSYGNLSQCRTAGRYVQWGRELRKKYQP
jgi:hypothetical protein